MMRYELSDELSDRKLSIVSHVRELDEFGQLGRPSKLVRQSAIMHTCQPAFIQLRDAHARWRVRGGVRLLP